MIRNLVRRDLRGRYKGSVLGFFWTILNPLLQLAVYTFLFSIVLKSGIDKYYLFLFVALVPWIFFSSCLIGGSGIILSQKDLIKKIYFWTFFPHLQILHHLQTLYHYFHLIRTLFHIRQTIFFFFFRLIFGPFFYFLSLSSSDSSSSSLSS